MLNAYIYPISSRLDKKIYNPYLDDFIESLSSDFIFLNKDKASNKGLFDILKYLWKTELVFFHWPENIPERKFGLAQTVFMSFLLFFLSLRKIHIIYVVHNKISHSNEKLWLKKKIVKQLTRHCSLLITHAKEGVDFINSQTKNKKQIFYFPHPVKKQSFKSEEKKNIDILIWGNIAPYKGVDRFLQLIKDSQEALKWKISIVGKVSSLQYYNTLIHLKSDNVFLLNEFVPESKINEFINQSKIVLFPYHKDSVLSSGVFAKTVIFPVKIVGPDCGSFADFKFSPQVFTFKDEGEIIKTISKCLAQPVDSIQKSSELIGVSYSWDKFAANLVRELQFAGNSKTKKIK